MRQSAFEVGFDDCGIAQACRIDDDADFMDQWVAQGWHGNMAYLERNRERRYNPQTLVDGAQTVIVCLLTYEHSGHDYHRTIKSKLYELEALLLSRQLITPTAQQNKFCDSAPFLERRWAQKAGLGTIGKNHQLIHPTLGSRVHIGELVLTEQTDWTERQTQETEQVPSPCDNCQRCIDACPGHALGQPQWDARKCIAYTTHKCTVCQDVCPINISLTDTIKPK
ncbi:MAG: DUF1730 domain-containing protein [Paludibacteraceae bacterium]|nr:DUF1730 domain-containing protein [Paludibacteraceae bacterium]